jgi:hypothetical protein
VTGGGSFWSVDSWESGNERSTKVDLAVAGGPRPLQALDESIHERFDELVDAGEGVCDAG